jgi:transposase
MVVPLSDEMWEQVAYLFEGPLTQKLGRPRTPVRAVLNGILWVHENSEKWQNLPGNFPPPQTCYIKWLTWKREGIMDVVIRTVYKNR